MASFTCLPFLGTRIGLVLFIKMNIRNISHPSKRRTRTRSHTKYLFSNMQMPHKPTIFTQATPLTPFHTQSIHHPHATQLLLFLSK